VGGGGLVPVSRARRSHTPMTRKQNREGPSRRLPALATLTVNTDRICSRATLCRDQGGLIDVGGGSSDRSRRRTNSHQRTLCMRRSICVLAANCQMPGGVTKTDAYSFGLGQIFRCDGIMLIARNSVILPILKSCGRITCISRMAKRIHMVLSTTCQRRWSCGTLGIDSALTDL